MEQRRLRLGDILDDYCPRERRVTNHAVVAMVEEDVKQTRCTTCDAEHAYKKGREPRRRKKDATAVLYQEVLAGMPDADLPPAAAGTAAETAGGSSAAPGVTGDLAEDLPLAGDPEPPAGSNGNGHYPGGAAVLAADDEFDDDPVDDSDAAGAPAVEEGPIHRRLIRATLPRPEGQKVERQVPDFTIRGNTPFRGDRSKSRGQGGGPTTDRGGRRFGGGGQGMPGGRGPSTGSGRGSSGAAARNGRPGFGGGTPQRSGGPSSGSGRGPASGSGRGPSTGSGRGPRKRSR